VGDVRELWDELVDPRGDFAIEVLAPVDAVAPHEVVEEGSGYREALVPADVLNRYPRHRVFDEA
jgi:hypothetical protein